MQAVNQSLIQRQVQHLSQRQIQALGFLSMDSMDLREEIFKAVNENPALEIVSDPLKSKKSAENYSKKSSISADAYQAALESKEDNRETLQHHLMSQVNMIKLSPDEKNLCERLIYNLDKYGFYGSRVSPESLLDRSRPLQNKKMLDYCIDLIQNMDPIGVCCKNAEESLFVQAKILGKASDLSLFLLDGNLEFLNPPNAESVLKKLENFKRDYHNKAFAKEILLDRIELSLEEVEKSIHYITSLNPFPAGQYDHDSSQIDFEKPDVILTVERVDGLLHQDDFSTGKIFCDNHTYFQVKYASGFLPEVRLVEGINIDKNLLADAKAFLGNLEYRKSTMVLQGCQIVHEQKEFFEKGPGHLKALTRRKVAAALGINESTVSRMSAKKNSKYIQTDWGLFPASYFYLSGVESKGNSDSDEKISADVIKAKIIEILEKFKAENPNKMISDSKLCQLLNDQGIKIARRTVTKYRQQAGIKNSYER
ncbi:MAG: hypothetical protein K5866_03340 [Treponema sp.]|nr:hypothetical protein [Treponema sp.]